jgi:hypothetical protein
MQRTNEVKNAGAFERITIEKLRAQGKLVANEEFVNAVKNGRAKIAVNYQDDFTIVVIYYAAPVYGLGAFGSGQRIVQTSGAAKRAPHDADNPEAGYAIAFERALTA